MVVYPKLACGSNQIGLFEFNQAAVNKCSQAAVTGQVAVIGQVAVVGQVVVVGRITVFGGIAVVGRINRSSW